MSRFLQKMLTKINFDLGISSPEITSLRTHLASYMTINRRIEVVTPAKLSCLSKAADTEAYLDDLCNHD
jgi:hypothetical protein